MASSGSHGGFGSWWHLVVRFFGALAPVGPRKSSQRWALDHLSPAEQSLFASMSGADRRHAVSVARSAFDLAAEDGRGSGDLPEAFAAAALLHDVGKIEAGLGTFGRVGATMAAMLWGRERLVGPVRPGMLMGQRARVASYLEHDRIGGQLLEEAGSDRLTISWARDHHLASHRWTVDEQVGDYLKRADGD